MDGGSYIHSTVIFVVANNSVVFSGAFGSLREMGVSLAFMICMADAPPLDASALQQQAATQITFSLQISGRDALKLYGLAPIVGKVLQQLLDSLAASE